MIRFSNTNAVVSEWPSLAHPGQRRFKSEVQHLAANRVAAIEIEHWEPRSAPAVPFAELQNCVPSEFAQHPVAAVTPNAAVQQSHKARNAILGAERIVHIRVACERLTMFR
jgi:hypothetical protein